jgi:ABC-type methionine transport system permease subunit
MNTPWNQVASLVVPALGQTLAMVGIVMVVVVVVGLPLGVVLHNTSPLGLFPNRTANTVLSVITNIGRSLPFLVLMAAVIPFTLFIVGTNIGIQAAIVPMSLAGIPFFSRIVENAIREIPKEITDVGIVSGGTRFQIVRSSQISEALPGLIAGLVINLIAMIEYSAIAGAVGAGGLGYLAINYGYQRFDATIMLSCVVILIALTQIIQFVGDRVVRAVSRVTVA